MPAENAADLIKLLQQTDGKPLTTTKPLFRGLDCDFHDGKVRDNYIFPDTIVMVATDRISAFDVVFPNGIPHKGVLLTQMSLSWFQRIPTEIVPNHLITDRRGCLPAPFSEEPLLEGRTILVQRLKMLPIECVARGYLTGSAWTEYQRNGTMAGEPLPKGLTESQELPEPIFTPATKAVNGHDLNITEGQTTEILTEYLKIRRPDAQTLTLRLKNTTLALYRWAIDYAGQRDVIIADTKFEFGLGHDCNLILADEVLTPDSSRFWDAKTYEPGKPQPSLDKQYVRDWAASSGWDKEAPAPLLPPGVVAQTRNRYLQAYMRLFG